METTAFVFVQMDGNPVPAGRLRIVEDGRHSEATFAYGRKYLARPDAFPIDPVQLPLTEGELSTEADFDLFNGIRDAAPDAWGRSLIDLHMMRAEGRPAMEAEYLLLSTRGTRVGGLQFGPTPDGPGPVLEMELPDTSSFMGGLEDFLLLVDRHESGSEIPDNLRRLIAPGSDMGGARPKGTVMIDGRPWLAKFPADRDRIDMAAAEAGCLDLCEMAGLEVCGRRVEAIGEDRVLLLERFDRDPGDASRRRHMVSSLTMLGAHESDRAVSGYADLRNAMRRFGSSDASEEIYTRMIMNVLLGNTDDHYRNHAFLMRDDGLYDLSPVYDVTPSLQVSTSRNMFLHLGRAGSGREATLPAAVAAGPDLGVPPDRAAEIANRLSRMVAREWEGVMRSRGSSDRDIEMMRNSFSEAGRTITREVEDPFSDPDPDLEPDDHGL